jgi:small subunit ribosomal protein S16
MLIIRLTRRGRRNDPSFRLVVTENSNPIKGKFLEELGNYSPKQKTKALAKERILYWISKGAQLSKTVNNLLINEKIIEGEKVKAWRPKRKESQGKESEKTVPPPAAKINKEEKPEEKAEPGSLRAGQLAEEPMMVEEKEKENN